MSEWHYKGKPFTSEMIGDYVGFVYCLTNLETKKKYIGQKRFKSKTKRPPLKGKKRKRTVIKESDWKTYYGSSEEVKNIVEEKGGDVFDREILHLCRSLGDLNYMELAEHMDREVLLKPKEYYNGFVGGKIHRNHVKHLWK